MHAGLKIWVQWEAGTTIFFGKITPFFWGYIPPPLIKMVKIKKKDFFKKKIERNDDNGDSRGNDGVSEQRTKGTTEPGNKGMREQGNERTIRIIQIQKKPIL